MSVWGKILGGVGGFAIGGPIGALIGALAGHAVDHLRSSGDDAPNASKQVAFTIAVIVLGAKMAKADGTVTREEIDAFKQVFHIPPDEMKNVGRVFNQARQDVAGFEAYAAQISRMFRENPAVLEELLDGLFHIARADGQVTEDELEYLEAVADIFAHKIGQSLPGLPPSKFFNIAKNRIYVCAKNYSLYKKIKRMGNIILFLFGDSIYYSYKFHSIKYFYMFFKAVSWNIINLKKLQKERRKIQKLRVKTDEEIEKWIIKRSIEIKLLKNIN